MEIFQVILFIFSLIALPWLTAKLLFANMREIGKAILLVMLFFACRYLWWTLWTPDEVGYLVIKSLFITMSAYSIFLVFLHWKNSKAFLAMRPLWGFVYFMSFPLLFGLILFERPFNSILFWIFWTFSAILLMVRFSSTKVMKRVLVIIAFLFLSIAFYNYSNLRDNSYIGNLKTYLHTNVVERWEPIKSRTEKIVVAWNALVEKDRKAIAKGKVGNRKVLASKAIMKQIFKLRQDLLTIDSQTVLHRISVLDAKISSVKKHLSSLHEKKGLDLTRAEKIDAKIAKLEAKLALLESERADAIATLRQDLKEIGLELPENSPVLTVDLGMLIDNAIVAKNIGFVVEQLKTQVDAEKGNTEAAKRYYGAYIVMLDVQAECFRQYLDTAATGIWCDGITDIAKDAEAAKKRNEAKANENGRSEEERKAYLHAAGTNDKTLKATQAYLDILRHHEKIIREKLIATEKRHEIALSFWESVDIASEFGDKAFSDLAEFEALLELKLPEIVFFDDEAMAAEFDAITQKLVKE